MSGFTPGTVGTDLTGTIGISQSLPVNRSVITGRTTSGLYKNVAINPEGSLKVSIDDPHSAFGELLSTHLTPITQVDATYGLRSTDIRILTSSANSTASVENRNFLVGTSNEANGFSTIQTLRGVKYRPGQGSRFRWTAGFPSGGVANSYQFAGAHNLYDMVGVGHKGTDFGMIHSLSGSAEIVTLQITTPAAAGETVTITLDGTEYTRSVTNGTVFVNAYEIASGTYENGVATWHVEQISSSICFHSNQAGVKGGTYHVSSTGNLTGAFTTLRVGADNDLDAGFISQSAWNIDTFDGSGGINNPSGVLLDSTKPAVYELSIQYLGYGALDLLVEDPSEGKFVHANRILWMGNSEPSLQVPTLKVGYIAKSLGSTANLAICGASLAGFVEGKISPLRNPRGYSTTASEVGTTETHIISFKISTQFKNQFNLNEMKPLVANLAVTSTSKPNSIFRIYRNVILDGVTDFRHVDIEDSFIHFDTSDVPVRTGHPGHLIASTVIGPDGFTDVDLSNLGVHIQASDLLTITCEATTSTITSVSVSLTWLED